MNSIALLASMTLSAQDTGIDPYLMHEFKDLTFTARVVKGDAAELAKVNKDFGQTYRFETVKFYIKEPFKLRSETNVEDTDILFILNGATQMYKVPKARISTKSDISKAPGRRQTTLDFGILTPSLFRSLYDAKLVRADKSGAMVFDLTYKKGLDDTSRSRVWLDPVKHYITKREWYGQTGSLKAVFYLDNPKLVNGLWLPTRLTVRNVDNKVAGITQYERLVVNSGLSDDLFKM